ncbi:MAG TPA: hypothetical protein PLA50_09995 [Bacteroidia bacterium]|nr:hypothetical protein [Bacteroidia bacterium]
MTNLIDVRLAADGLTEEERAGLAAHLLASLPSAPAGADDDEADSRDREMDEGAVATLSYEQFLDQVGRR